jgi:hypothetical protein
MTTLASLGLQTKYQDVIRGHLELDKLTAASARAQAGAEKLANASIKNAQAQKQQTSATIEANKQTLSAIQAEQKLEALRLQAQITDQGRQESLRRLAQLGRDAQAVTTSIATAQVQATQNQNAYNRSLETYAQVAVRGIQLQKEMAQTAQHQINASLGIGQGGGLSAADLEENARAADALRAKFNPLFAASKQYEAVLNEINAAEAKGILLEHEATAAREMAAKSYLAEGAAARTAGGAVAGAAGSLGQLSFQINDIATGLAMGQSPFQIMAQQGGQVFQIWQMNRDVFSNLAGKLKSLATLSNLFLLGGAGAIVGSAAALASFIQTEKAAELATSGLGRASGATAADIQAIATQAAATGRVSVDQAIAMQAAFAQTGKIGKENFLGLTSVVKDFSTQTGQSTDDAAKALAKMAADPIEGIDQLAASVGGVSGRTRELILQQIAQGNQQRAVTLFVEAAQRATDDYETHLTALGRTGDAVLTALKNGWHGLGGTIDDGLGKLSKFNFQHLSALQTLANLIPGGQALLALSLAQGVSGAAGKGGNPNQGAVNFAYGQLGSADEATGYKQLFQLQAQAGNYKAALAKAQANPDAFSPAQIERMRDALARTTGQIESMTDANGLLITSEDVRLRQDQLTIQGLTARTPADQAAIARQQTYLSLVGANISATQRTALANSAAAVAFATAQKALDDQNKTIRLNIEGQMAMANALGRGDAAGAMIAQARYQALQEKIGNPGIDVEIRQRQLLQQAIGGQVDSLTAQIDTQTRLNAITKAANDNVSAGLVPFDRLNDLVQQNVQLDQLAILKKAALAIGNQAWVDTIDKAIDRLPTLTKEMQANADQAARLAALNPNDADQRLIVGIQGMSTSGQITPDHATAAIAGTSLRQANTGLLTGLGQTNPFGAAGQLGVEGRLQGIGDERAQRLKLAEDSIKDAQLLADAKVAIEQDAAHKTLQVYTDLSSAQMALGEQTFGSLADGLGDLVGKNNAAYKALFAVQKAFSIASATINMWRAISEASTLPWPANIPAMAEAAAQAGAILSSIGSISGFKDGVVGLQGPGTGTSDSIPAWLSAGESIVTASGTKGNENTLAAMNRGGKFDNGGSQHQISIHFSAPIDARGAQQGSGEQIRGELERVLPIFGAQIISTVREIIPGAVAKANANPRYRGKVG